MSVLRDESFYYQYEYNGGTIEMPKEVFWELYNDSKEEIERLNNGIKELDDMFYETFRISQNGYYSISEWVLKEFTDKIKELKGSDSNG